MDSMMTDCDLMNKARELAINGKVLQKFEELVMQSKNIVEFKLAKLLHDHATDILYERRTGIFFIIGAGLLTPLYQSALLMTSIYAQLNDVPESFAYASPNSHVLEVRGGTGGAKRIAMKAFTGLNVIKAYKDYTFTHISAGFLSSA